jgi:RNA polymerase sigma-70 factor (ECF subfamily)
MTQEELLVLVYKKDERALHIFFYDMYLKSLFSVINVLVKTERKEDVYKKCLTKYGKTLILIMKPKTFYTWILNLASRSEAAHEKRNAISLTTFLSR